MTKPFQLLTKSGYDFFECASAFQKSIRRGLEDEAMFWAIELYESGYQKYVWKRMLIMISEDVGLAMPEGPAVVGALKQMYDHFVSLKDKHKPEKLHFVHAVQYLVRAKKSRYIDLSISVHWTEWHKGRGEKQIPDFAFDMHTRRGKKMGWGLDHFYDDGMLIENAEKVDREQEFEALARGADKYLSDMPNDDEMQKLDSKPIDNQGKLF